MREKLFFIAFLPVPWGDMDIKVLEQHSPDAGERNQTVWCVHKSCGCICFFDVPTQKTASRRTPFFLAVKGILHTQLGQ